MHFIYLNSLIIVFCSRGIVLVARCVLAVAFRGFPTEPSPRQYCRGLPLWSPVVSPLDPAPVVLSWSSAVVCRGLSLWFLVQAPTLNPVPLHTTLHEFYEVVI